MHKISILQQNFCVQKVSGVKDEHFLYFVFFARTHRLGPMGQNSARTRSAEANFGPTLARGTQNINFSEKCRMVTPRKIEK